jgi:hypothetical protein
MVEFLSGLLFPEGRRWSATIRHAHTLDWNYPPDPSPWSTAERERFEQAAGEILSTIRMELGSEFEVVYEAL